MLSPDFREMRFELSAAETKFSVVGAYALAAYGHPRATCKIGDWPLGAAYPSAASLLAGPTDEGS
jgi:hypothetical protein